jgi:hypothetical protein
MTVDGMDSDVDDDDIFPVTPDSKHSHPPRRFTSVRVKAGSSTSSRSTSESHEYSSNNNVDLHHKLPSAGEYHSGKKLLGGSVRVNDDTLVDDDKPINGNKPINDDKSQSNVVSQMRTLLF